MCPIVVFVAMLFSLSAVFAQSSIQLSPWQPAVSIDGRALRYPFAGGLNNPQVCAIDLNNDNLQDLYIFDRTGNVQLFFENQGQPGQPFYVYAPQWEAQFPPLTDWVLLRDYNGDGIEDIFAYGDAPFSGVRVYRGYYTSDNKIAFSRYNFDNPLNLIYIPLQTGGETQLYISAIDYPAVDDLDCDGDLDMATFNINGGYAELYKNFSVEMGYGRDSLIYRLADDCWGGFYESGIGGNQVDLSPTANGCSGNFQGGGGEAVTFRHAGSTLLTFDADNDGDKDLVLGDLSYVHLNFLTNGGNCANAWFVDQDLIYPSYNVPAELIYFPASFYVDVDGDGHRDMLAAPNQKGGSQDVECLWLYENTGTDGQPDFSLLTRRWLVDEMIDLGTGALPFPVDYNADGLLDIVVGNNSFFQISGNKDARLLLFKNVGTPTDPAFELVDDDYLGFSQYSNSSFWFAPAFGDLDSDGDLDLLVGEQNGRLFYAQNTAGAGQPLAFGPVQYSYMNISIGQASIPRLIDLNRDGLMDLVVGERSGNLNYFQNQGTPTQPMFNSDFSVSPNIQLMGGVDTRVPGSTIGYAAPWFLDYGQQVQVLTGTNTGRLEWYGDVLGNLTGTFSLIEETFAGLNAGSQTCPVMADWNNDGQLDLLVGNQRGGLQFFQTNITTEGIVGLNTVAEAPDARVFPNPARQQITVSWAVDGRYAATLYDLNGRMLKQWDSLSGDTPQPLAITGLPAGMYALQLRNARHALIRKIAIME